MQVKWHKNGSYDYSKSYYKAEFIARGKFAKRVRYL